MPDTPANLPDFVSWPSFPFEGDLRVKPLEPVADHEPPRQGEDAGSCLACSAPDEAYIWVSERWRVRTMDRPTGLPMVLILESRSHLDLGDLPNLLAAELGVMTVRLERAIRSLDGVARVHVNRWGDGSAHLHLWFLARPTGRLQLRGSFLSLWDEILPPIPESQWRENLALVAAWLAEFGGRPLAEPPRIEWQAPSTLLAQSEVIVADTGDAPVPPAPAAESAPGGVAPSESPAFAAPAPSSPVDQSRTFVGTAPVGQSSPAETAPGDGMPAASPRGPEAAGSPSISNPGAHPAASSAAS